LVGRVAAIPGRYDFPLRLRVCAFLLGVVVAATRGGDAQLGLVTPHWPAAVTPFHPSLESNTPKPAGPGTAVPNGQRPPVATRRPKRRRWLPPGSPAERNAESVDLPPVELHPCPFCGQRHQPVRLGGSGLAAAYGRQLVAEPGQGRPVPLGRDPGHTLGLVRDRFSPWRAYPAEVPPPPGPMTFCDRITRFWYGDDQESNDRR
jgi:hypothetical protein